jgi:hypothetical protein
MKQMELENQAIIETKKAEDMANLEKVKLKQ